MKLGKEIQLARISSGYTLRGFARLAEISPTYLSRIERGHFVPGEDVCNRIALLLGWNKELTVIKAGHIPVRIRELFMKYPRQLMELIASYKG